MTTTLELRDLRLIAAIDECGGVTKASAALNLTQSALSHQLADLERRLGVAVFARQGKRMVLTPAGERLRDAARPILGSVAAVEAETRNVATQKEEVLRLSTECYTCYHWLPAVMTEFRRKYPKVEPRIVAGATKRVVPALLKGMIDVAIVSDPVRDRRIQLTPLFRDELVVIVAPTHPWANRRSVEPRDFADEHVFTYASRSESTLFQKVLIPAGVTPREHSSVELTEAMVEMVKGGLGVALLARWAAAPHLRAGTLRAVRVTEAGLPREWSAATLRYKTPRPQLEALIEALQRNVVVRGGAELKLVKA
jgi:LysR family transcriptional regulator for metE and metH